MEGGGRGEGGGEESGEGGGRYLIAEAGSDGESNNWRRGDE